MAVSLTFVEKTGVYYTFARDEASLFKLRSFFGSRVLSQKDQSLTLLVQRLAAGRPAQQAIAAVNHLLLKSIPSVLSREKRCYLVN